MDDQEKPKYVVSMGDPFNGLTLHGPFEDANTAGEWAGENYKNETWTVVQVREPLPTSDECHGCYKQGTLKGSVQGVPKLWCKECHEYEFGKPDQEKQGG